MAKQQATLSAEEKERARHRTGNHAWKGIYGIDRKYTARVNRAKERGQYTESKRERAERAA